MTQIPREHTKFAPTRAGTVQRACACGKGKGACGCPGEGERVQRSRLGAGPASVPPEVSEVVRSSGKPLDPATRAVMEARLGHNFGHVRVHADERAGASAAAVAARAYAVGSHVVFSPGSYAPGTSAGQSLLAHELVHTVQQGARAGLASTHTPPSALSMGDPESSSEREAERASERTSETGGSTATNLNHPAGAGSVQRQPAPDPTGQVNLKISENGRVELTVSGPKQPVIGKPTLGVRRNPDGTFSLVFGNTDKTVAPSDIPDLLKGSLNKPGPGGGKQVFRTPTCAQLRIGYGGRFMTFAEYGRSQLLSPDLLPMTPAVYEARLATCRAEGTSPSPPPPAPLPPIEMRPMQDLPGPNLPEGTALA